MLTRKKRCALERSFVLNASFGEDYEITLFSYLFIYLNPSHQTMCGNWQSIFVRLPKSSQLVGQILQTVFASSQRSQDPWFSVK